MELKHVFNLWQTEQPHRHHKVNFYKTSQLDLAANFLALFALFMPISSTSSSVMFLFSLVTFPVPMVPLLSLMVKLCPSSTTMGFNILSSTVASSPGKAISLSTSWMKALQSQVLEKHESCVPWTQGFFLPPSSGVMKYTWALKLSCCLTDLGLTTHMPLLTSVCLRPLARRPIWSPALASSRILWNISMPVTLPLAVLL